MYILYIKREKWAKSENDESFYSLTTMNDLNRVYSKEKLKNWTGWTQHI